MPALGLPPLVLGAGEWEIDGQGCGKGLLGLLELSLGF